MSMFEVRADIIARNKQSLDRFRTRMEAEANRKYMRVVRSMYRELLKVSPQYSGNFVSNWQFQIDDNSVRGYQEWRNKGDGEKRIAGDTEAVDYSLRRMYSAGAFTFKQKVYFLNDTPLTFTESTVSDSTGQVRNLRPGNMIADMAQISSYLKAYVK